MPNSSNPSISIIMPVYNAELHIGEAVESALSQSLQSIELICIDDGSTDASPDILRDLRVRDGRINIISQDNLGAGPARNAGLSVARGEYIAFLDADDFYPNTTCLQELYDLAAEYDVKIAGGSLLFLDNGQISNAAAGDVDFTFDSVKTIKYKDFQQAYYYQRFIYSREMLGNAGIVFPDYRRFQDVVFFVKAMTEADEFAATDAPSYVYRKSKNYMSLNNAQINDMLRGYIDVLSLARDNHFSELFSFLSQRVIGPNNITEMIKSSISDGNQAAEDLYSRVCDICSSCAYSPRNNYATGLLSKLRLLFSEFKKK